MNITFKDKTGKQRTATFHTSINTLPIRQHKLAEKFSLIDVGVGSTINDINRHLARFDQFMSVKDYESLAIERQNLQINFSFLLSKQAIPVYILSAFLKELDGEQVKIMEEDDIDKYYTLFETSDLTYGVVKELVETQKKSLVEN